MRKQVALFLFGIFVVTGAVADCGIQSDKLDAAVWNKDMTDDDLLFSNYAAWNAWKESFNKSVLSVRPVSTNDGNVYMCGYSCGQRVNVLAEPGWVFQGRRLDSSVWFRCEKNGYNNIWKQKTVPDCSSAFYARGLENQKMEFENSVQHSFYKDSNGVCLPNDAWFECLGLKNSGVDVQWSARSGKCVCAGDNRELSNGRCVQVGGETVAQNADTCVLKNGQTLSVGKQLPATVTLNGCKNYVDDKHILDSENGTMFSVVCHSGGGAVCKAIECKPKYKANEFTGVCEKESVTKPAGNINAVSLATQSVSAKQFAAKTVQKPENTKGNATKTGVSSCEFGRRFLETNYADWRSRFAQNEDILAVITEFEAECTKGEKTEKEMGVILTRMLNGVGGVTTTLADGAIVTQSLATEPASTEDARATKCKSVAGAVWDDNARVCGCVDTDYEYNDALAACVETQAAISARIAQDVRVIKGKLDSMHAQLPSPSVWKTEQGNFNGARLASDTIAGVVLGTAGGLITSNIIKKNQVSGGFENVQCTIGGQVVSGFGDVFNVGIR